MTYLEIWNKHLENMKKKLVDYTPSLPIDSDYFAVIVEPRVDENIETIIKTVMYYLEDSSKKWGLQIFHGTKNIEQILIAKNSISAERFFNEFRYGQFNKKRI